MKKLLILLLVAGFLLGTLPLVDVVCEEGSPAQSMSFTDQEFGGFGDPVPCGNGEGGPGGPPVPN